MASLSFRARAPSGQVTEEEIMAAAEEFGRVTEQADLVAYAHGFKVLCNTNRLPQGVYPALAVALYRAMNVGTPQSIGKAKDCFEVVFPRPPSRALAMEFVLRRSDNDQSITVVAAEALDLMQRGELQDSVVAALFVRLAAEGSRESPSSDDLLRPILRAVHMAILAGRIVPSSGPIEHVAAAAASIAVHNRSSEVERLAMEILQQLALRGDEAVTRARHSLEMIAQSTRANAPVRAMARELLHHTTASSSSLSFGVLGGSIGASWAASPPSSAHGVGGAASPSLVPPLPPGLHPQRRGEPGERGIGGAKVVLIMTGQEMLLMTLKSARH
jgi:hypothetical protein